MSDLRILKTKKYIEEAFLTLRQNCELDKIKVNDLCKLALINKTTFYNYYENIYDLSEELENKYLEKCFYGFDGYDCLITDTEKFILGVYKSFVENQNIQIIFKNRVGSLVKKAEQKVLELYKKDISSEEIKMRIMFLIHGAFYLLFSYNAKNNEEEKLKIIIEYAKIVWNKNKQNSI
ncbi:MAG: TetR/AcrR family transcriptional regulator [Clostridia bacterium]|nr:TetR/AcrR family transcriptional regulator [Clostridia bacterium]